MKPAVYKRPQKPMHLTVRRREGFANLDKIEVSEPLTVDKATECHVTPEDVARRMVRYLGPAGDYLTLEPSAGTGQIVRALIASGHSPCEIVMVERHIKLAASLSNIERQGAGLINRCFLEYAAEVRGKVEFPRVIMNPPFSQVRNHIAAALALMGRHGHATSPVLVALVPITYQHDDAETLEILPPDTFVTAKVNTKIIRIEKP